MNIPKPRPVTPLPRKVIRGADQVPREEEVAVLFNGQGEDRVLVVRIGVDLTTGEILISRCVAEGLVMQNIARAWFTVDRIGEVWDLATDGVEYDWALVIPDPGVEFVLGHIGSDDFAWADLETFRLEVRSGICDRLSLGKPGVEEATLKRKKHDMTLSGDTGKKILRSAAEVFGPVGVKADLNGIPEFKSAFGLSNDVFVAWTDGSYITRGSLRGSAVVTSTGHWVAVQAPTGKAEYAEIYAILLAVSHGIRSQARKVTIKSDSRAALFAVEQWLDYRQDKVKFSNTNMNKVLNKIKDLVTKYPVEFEFVWIKGHVGNPGNEAADRLSRLVARRIEVGLKGVTDEEARGILTTSGVFDANGKRLVKLS